MNLKITHAGRWFNLEWGQGERLHVLNETALKTNLKHVFGLHPAFVAAVIHKVKTLGSYELTLDTKEIAS